MGDPLDAVRILNLKRRTDARGWLVEILRSEDLPKSSKAFGQIYIVASNRGVVRANHYHKRKSEWFHVHLGSARLDLLSTTSRKRMEIIMSEDDFLVVKIPPGIAHAITNIGNGIMYLLAYVDEPYNPSDPDTYPYDLLSN